MRRCYSRAEQSTSNCSGDHRYRKRKLSPNRMEAVKRATFAVYPVKPGESREDAWKQYKIAIDTSCRQISRPKKTAKWYLCQGVMNIFLFIRIVFSCIIANGYKPYQFCCILVCTYVVVVVLCCNSLWWFSLYESHHISYNQCSEDNNTVYIATILR